MLTLIVTLSLMSDEGRVFFLLKMTSNDSATISRKHFWISSISLRDSRKLWPEIEARCSYEIVLIPKKKHLYLSLNIYEVSYPLYRQKGRRGKHKQQKGEIMREITTRVVRPCLFRHLGSTDATVLALYPPSSIDEATFNQNEPTSWRPEMSILLKLFC